MTGNDLGRHGEAIAAHFLQAQGLSLIESNWRAGKTGEIDLIMCDQEEIVFVEVKARRGPGVEEAVTPAKL